jgi:NAD/NADP transhydrogenase alpha subunit
MVGIGGLFIMGGGYLPGTIPQALGALSVLLASVNVAGGFVITKRMLDMFKRWFLLVYLGSRTLIPSQGQLTRRSTPGYMASRLQYSQEVSWPQQALGWLVSSKLGT